MTLNPHTGFNSDDFLIEEGLYEKCTATAIKRVLARQLTEEMKRQNKRQNRDGEADADQ